MKQFQCNHDCNAKRPKELNNFCGYSRRLESAHDQNDSRCNKHLLVKEICEDFTRSSTSSTWLKDSRFKPPPAEQQEGEGAQKTHWTQDEVRDLEKAFHHVKKAMITFQKLIHSGKRKKSYKERLTKKVRFLYAKTKN